MENEQLLLKARARVAERYPQQYHKNAIMRGDWDKGSLVRDEIAKLKGKQNDKGTA